jgi:hypothetical protein
VPTLALLILVIGSPTSVKAVKGEVHAITSTILKATAKAVEELQFV